MPYIRGSNPIWFEVDLAANAFDDTFYLFVLQNTIPYLPAPVYHSENGTEWNNPIKFLANGTLPVDIFFNPEVVYRLEFRHGPTQQDALIYLVENYIPNGSGNSPSGEGTITTDNQITNAQFSLINFTSPTTLSSITDPDPIAVAPGWTLNVAGTGTVVMSQEPLTDSTSTTNPTNAPYALRLTLSGTFTSAYLSQVFLQNGNQWASGQNPLYLATSVTARLQGASAIINAEMVNSESEVLTTVLFNKTVTEEWTEYTDLGLMPAPQDGNTPPDSYLEYRLILPTTVDIYLTSFQLIAADQPFAISYQQDSIQRQVDHTYHLAYPIVPVGMVIDYAGFVVPAHYLICDGTAINRTTYNLLFQSLTKTETVSLTSTVSTFTVASSADYHVGMAIEGNGIPSSTTISGISGTTITMSAPASATVSSSVRFFAWGAGDGTTTFNAPLLQDYVTAGANGSLLGAGQTGVGAKGGAATHTLSISEMPAHTHPGSTIAFTTSSGNTVGGTPSNGPNFVISPGTVTVATQGDGGAFGIIQQTALMKKCIRFE